VTYDMTVINGIENVIARPGIPYQMTVDLRGSGSGSVISGIQKTIQRFIILLFTEMGSVLFWPNTGCRFMTDVKQGRLRTAADVSQSFASAMIDLRRQFALQVLDTDTLTDQIDNVELLSADIGDGRVTLSLKLTTLAGDSPDIQVTLPTLPRTS